MMHEFVEEYQHIARQGKVEVLVLEVVVGQHGAKELLQLRWHEMLAEVRLAGILLAYQYEHELIVLVSACHECHHVEEELTTIFQEERLLVLVFGHQVIEQVIDGTVALMACRVVGGQAVEIVHDGVVGRRDVLRPDHRLEVCLVDADGCALDARVEGVELAIVELEPLRAIAVLG